MREEDPCGRESEQSLGGARSTPPSGLQGPRTLPGSRPRFCPAPAWLLRGSRDRRRHADTTTGGARSPAWAGAKQDSLCRRALGRRQADAQADAGPPGAPLRGSRGRTFRAAELAGRPPKAVSPRLCWTRRRRGQAAGDRGRGHKQEAGRTDRPWRRPAEEVGTVHRRTAHLPPTSEVPPHSLLGLCSADVCYTGGSGLSCSHPLRSAEVSKSILWGILSCRVVPRS
ncbi:uncharacterized protein LOC115527403 [Lynx canadensis]|uniref:uncharacterized protein LOC115527403 n=1 Tax=Lynx canadensis TaxID=61383 RepID=UPI0011B07AA3|nr:uncharacterized protein LOC115527403 [Lynx canadensis]